MADLPIPFTAPMISALTAGRKTMTRRIIDPQPELFQGVNPAFSQLHARIYGRVCCIYGSEPASPPFNIKYMSGDRLWVREAYFQIGHWEEKTGEQTKQGRVKWGFAPDSSEIRFDAPDEFRLGRHAADPETPAWHKRLGRFMPRAASRLTLIVESVKVERLQDISREDAMHESVEFESADPPFYYVPGLWPHSLTAVGVEERGDRPHAVRSFAKLWTYINGPDSWGANPWVAAIGFRVVKANIDTLEIANRTICEEVTA